MWSVGHLTHVQDRRLMHLLLKAAGQVFSPFFFFFLLFTWIYYLMCLLYSGVERISYFYDVVTSYFRCIKRVKKKRLAICSRARQHQMSDYLQPLQRPHTRRPSSSKSWRRIILFYACSAGQRCIILRFIYAGALKSSVKFPVFCFTRDSYIMQSVFLEVV